jgi:hypothetical protein
VYVALISTNVIKWSACITNILPILKMSNWVQVEHKLYQVFIHVYKIADYVYSWNNQIIFKVSFPPWNPTPSFVTNYCISTIHLICIYQHLSYKLSCHNMQSIHINNWYGSISFHLTSPGFSFCLINKNVFHLIILYFPIIIMFQFKNVECVMWLHVVNPNRRVL